MTLPAGQDPSPETPQSKEIAQESPRETAIQESQRERADLGLERLQSDIDKIDAIDVNKSPEAQKENIRILESVSFLIIGKLLGKYDKARLKTEIRLIEELPNPNDIERMAIIKIKEILSSPNKPIFKWLEKWGSLVERGDEALKRAQNDKDKLEQGDGKKWSTGKIIMTAALVAGGAYAGYKLVDWITKKFSKDKDQTTPETEPQEEKKGGFWKTLAKTLGISGALSAVMIGACLIDPKHIGEWVSDNLGVSLTKESFMEFFSHLVKGEWEEAFKALSSSIEVTNPLIAESAAVIGMDPKTLLIFKDKKYKRLAGIMGDLQRGLETVVTGLLEDYEIPMVFSGEQKAKCLEDTKKLAEFLDEHKKDIAEIKPPPETVEDVLTGLKRMGKLGTPAEQTQPQQEEPAGQLEDGKLDERIFPSASAAIERWQSNGGEISETPELAAEIMQGTIEDGGAVIIHDGVVLLFKAGAAVVLTSVAVVVETFQEIAKAIFTDEESDVVETYWDSGGKYFVYAGLAGGGAKGVTYYMKTHNVLGSVRAGGRVVVRGIAGPAEVLRITAHTGLDIYRQGVDFYYKGRKLTTSSEVVKIKWAHARAKFHAEIFRRYLTALHPKNFQGKALQEYFQRVYGKFYETRLQAVLQRHAMKFISSLKDYYYLTNPEAIKQLPPVDDLTQFTQKVSVENCVNDFMGKQTVPEYITAGTIKSRAERMAKEAGKSKDAWQEFEAQARTALEEDVAKMDSALESAANPSPTEGTATPETTPAPKLSAKLAEKLRKLGVSDELIAKMQEKFRLTETQVRQLIKDLGEKADSKLKISKLTEVLKDPKYAKYTPVIKKALVGGLGFLAAIMITHGYENTTDKAGYLIKTGAEFGAFWAGAKATEMTFGKAVTHPIARFLVDLAGGMAGALGMGMVWNSTGGYMLDKYCPDRDVKFAESTFGQGLDGATTVLGWAVLTDPGEWILEQVGLQGGVDEDTDPIAYLQDKVRMMRPFGQSGWSESIFKDMPTHTIGQLEEEAQKTMEDVKEDLVDLQKDLEEARKDNNEDEIAELEEKIAKKEETLEKLTSLATGQWVKETMARLALNEELFLTPAQAEFRRIADTKFKGGGEKFDQIMTALEQGQEKTTDEGANQVWKYLVGESAKINDAEISFRDFILSKKLTKEQTAFVGKYLSHVEQKGKPETPTEGGVDSEQFVA